MAAAAKTKALTKSDVIAKIAEQTEFDKKQIGLILNVLGDVVGDALKQGVGVTLAGFAKFKVILKPATPARRGVNPFTKLEQDFPAKPARKVIKLLPLKALKDQVSNSKK